MATVTIAMCGFVMICAKSTNGSEVDSLLPLLLSSPSLPPLLSLLLQFHNHLLMDIELYSALPLSRKKKERMAIIKPDQSYAVPVEMAHAYEFYVVPAGFG